MPALRSTYIPVWMPLYPRDAVHGAAPRTAPVGWICPDGHRHIARICTKESAA